jgi:hypothetical protein
LTFNNYLACFRLHNKALDDRLPLVVDGQIPILDNNHIVDAINNINQAHAIRQRLIQRFKHNMNTQKKTYISFDL